MFKFFICQFIKFFKYFNHRLQIFNFIINFKFCIFLF